MNVLVLGSGGREHALCETIRKSRLCDELYAIPGNPGIGSIATCMDINPMDFIKIKEFCISHKVELLIPGSEVYLERGVSDVFQDSNILVFGPSQRGAMIETSKEFAKSIMDKYNIPTAKYRLFNCADEAHQYLLEIGVPIVIKYNGLAGGKGVVVAQSQEEANAAIDIMLRQKVYGDSGVIIEEYLEGLEFSLMCFVHENHIIPMPIAQDHKRLLDGDLGPNTGGMGIYSSVPIIEETVIKQSMDTIMKPIISALLQEGIPYTGFLYGGLMLTKDGPKVIEFNARFGDPEAEVILPKLESDILEVIQSITQKKDVSVTWSRDYVVGVVMASKGYPSAYKTGFSIQGISTCSHTVFHMGTSCINGEITTNGGRVLLVTGRHKVLQKAIEQAYNNVKKIKCDQLIYRTDIGRKSL